MTILTVGSGGQILPVIPGAQADLAAGADLGQHAGFRRGCGVVVAPIIMEPQRQIPDMERLAKGKKRAARYPPAFNS